LREPSAPLQRLDGHSEWALPACAGRGRPRGPALRELRSASECCPDAEVARCLGHALPLRSWPEDPSRAVFPAASPSRRFNPPRRSSPAVPLSYRACSRRPRREPEGRSRLSWGSVPFSAISPGSPLAAGASQVPATFRLQGFAPSCRLPPPRASRACFIPEALMGFTLQGLPLPRSRTAFPAARCPPGVGVTGALPTDLESVGPADRRFEHRGTLADPAMPSARSPARLQGLAPLESPFATAHREACCRPVPSWASSPPGFPTPRAAGRSPAPPLSCSGPRRSNGLPRWSSANLHPRVSTARGAARPLSRPSSPPGVLRLRESRR
jgi:hypothetical protein